MATDNRTLPAYFNTDADFRTWGTGIAAQLTACGLVQTANTGQINWTTVAKPTGGATMMGYEVWRFADTLQATAPVFIKIEYGSGSGVTDNPGFYVTVATATNGAGTMSGVVSTRQQMGASASKTAGATLNSYCCGSATTGRVMLVTNVDAANYSYWIAFCIERVRTGAGTTSGDGVSCMWWSQNWGAKSQIVPATGTVATQASNYFPASLPTGALVTYGTNVALFPVVLYVGKCYWSMNVGYFDANFAAWTPITGTHLGATRTFLPLGTLLPFGVSSQCQLAMLWE